MKNVISAPLMISEKAVGIIGLADMAADFKGNDANIVTGLVNGRHCITKQPKSG